MLKNIGKIVLILIPITFSLTLASCGDGGGNLLCGNGYVDSGEECDDGNEVSGDGCSASCTTEAAVCGNGIVERGEGCDDGNQTVEYNGCTDACQRAGFTFINYYGQTIKLELWTGAQLNYNAGTVEGSNLYLEYPATQLLNGNAWTQSLNQGNEELLVILGVFWSSIGDYRLFLERTYTNHAAGNVYILDRNGQLSVQSNLYNIDYTLTTGMPTDPTLP